MNLVAAVFASITGWLEQSIGIAIGAAFIWGVCSVVLSPCHVTSIPLAVGYVSGRGKISVRTAFSLSLAFGLGILATVAAVGGLTAALGRMLGDVGALKYVVAIIFVLVGLWLTGAIRLPEISLGTGSRVRGRGVAGAMALGLLFGLALGPCSFGFMMPLLAVAFRSAAARPALSIGLLGSYALGHVAIIVTAGTFANLVQRWLDWNEHSSEHKDHPHRLRCACHSGGNRRDSRVKTGRSVMQQAKRSAPIRLAMSMVTSQTRNSWEKL